MVISPKKSSQGLQNPSIRLSIIRGEKDGAIDPWKYQEFFFAFNFFHLGWKSGYFISFNKICSVVDCQDINTNYNAIILAGPIGAGIILLFFT